MMRALDPKVHDPVFEAIEGLLPEPPEHPLGCHRPRVSDRLCFEGLLVRLVTGAAWTTVEYLLGHQVSDTTLRARRDEWIAHGVFDQLAQEALAAYHRIIGLDTSDVIIDGSDHLAPCGGEGTGIGPAHRGRQGYKWSCATDANGIPLGWTLDGANRNDYRMLNDTLDTTLAIVPAPGWIGTLHLDRGYGYKSLSDKVAGYPIANIDVIPRRQRGQGRIKLVGFGKRWIGERTHSWLRNYGQLRRNTDRRSKHRHAAICLAATLVMTAKLVDIKNHNHRPIR